MAPRPVRKARRFMTTSTSDPVLGVVDEPIKVAAIKMQAARKAHGGQSTFPHEFADSPCRQRKVVGGLLERQEAPARRRRSGLAVRSGRGMAQRLARLWRACARPVPDRFSHTDLSRSRRRRIVARLTFNRRLMAPME